LLNDANDDSREKIYTDFNFNLEAESESPSSEDPPVKQGPWGIYAVKPLRQNQWETAVKNEIDKMMEQRIEEYWPYMTHVPEVAKVDTNEDSRPRLYCRLFVLQPNWKPLASKVSCKVSFFQNSLSFFPKFLEFFSKIP
jgi:hypothetical protein